MFRQGNDNVTLVDQPKKLDQASAASASAQAVNAPSPAIMVLEKQPLAAEKVAIEVKQKAVKPSAGCCASPQYDYSLFVHQIDVKSDLIYGFFEPRQRYLNALSNGSRLLKEGYLTADARNEWIVPAVSSMARAAMPPHVAAYHQFLEKHPQEKYRRLASRSLLDDNDEYMVNIVRSCKANIAYTVQNNAHIHFILDDGRYPWDMKAVARKYNRVGGLATVKELRFIYKHRATFASNILFWKDGEIVPAPWDVQPEIWARFWRRKKPIVSQDAPAEKQTLHDNWMDSDAKEAEDPQRGCVLM
jgi:hypothetical protein